MTTGDDDRSEKDAAEVSPAVGLDQDKTASPVSGVDDRRVPLLDFIDGIRTGHAPKWSGLLGNVLFYGLLGIIVTPILFVLTYNFFFDIHASAYLEAAHRLIEPSKFAKEGFVGTELGMVPIGQWRTAIDHRFAMGARGFGFLVAIFLAGALFRFRCRARFFYGIVEILFGILTIGLAASAPGFLPDGSGRYMQLFGGFYIIVRGLDNYREGIKALHPRYWRYAAFPDSIARRSLWSGRAAVRDDGPK